MGLGYYLTEELEAEICNAIQNNEHKFLYCADVRRRLSKTFAVSTANVYYHLQKLVKMNKLVYKNYQYSLPEESVNMVVAQENEKRIQQLELKVNTLLALFAATGKHLEQFAVAVQ